MEFESLRFLTFFVVSVSVFTSVILIFKGSLWPLNNRLMGLIFFITNIYLIVTALIYSGNLLDFPILFRAFAPLYFLIGPLLFFYIRGAVFNKKISWQKDWYHFVPAIIQFLDLIPFYLRSNIEKRAILEKVLADSRLINTEGDGFFIEAEVYATARLVLVFAYLGYMIVCLFINKRRIYDYHHGKALFQMLILILTVFVLGSINTAISLINSFTSSSPINPFTANTANFVIAVVSFLSVIFLHGFIFFMPENIFKIPDPSSLKKFEGLKQKFEEQTNQLKFENESNFADKDDLLSKLELGIKVEKWYKINGLTVEECAKMLECEKYVLSRLINSHYKMRFNDLINLHRVEFVKSEIKKGSTKNITLEGLSEEAGFNSRTTFYNAFIKHEGISPMEFLKNS